MTQTYRGSCHCGAVRIEATTELSKLVSCNCSICVRTGALLAFMPEAGFTQLSGADQLTDYQFGKKRIHHTFCNACGCRVFARGTAPDGSQMVALNVRCLEDVDLGAYEVVHYDGKHLA